MLHEAGTVVAVDSDGVWVETLQTSACARCAAKQGCGQKLLAGSSAGRNMTFIKAYFDPARSPEVWRVGDRAVLGIEENALVKATLIAYMLPLLCMVLAVAGLNHFVTAGDGASALAAVFGLVGGALLVRWHSSTQRGNSCYQATLVGRALA